MTSEQDKLKPMSALESKSNYDEQVLNGIISVVFITSSVQIRAMPDE
jgi:hypothetical protein